MTARIKFLLQRGLRGILRRLSKLLESTHDKYEQIKSRRLISSINSKLLEKDNLEQINCYLCKSSRSTFLCKVSGLSYRKCDSCGLVYVNPRLREQVYFRVYDRHYWFERRKALGERKISERVEINLKAATSRINLLSQFVKSGSLLDIGCADGASVYAASIMGFDAYGIEVSDYLINYSKSLYPSIRTYKSVLELPEKTRQNGFQLILLRDVIEHFYDPINEMTQIKKLLAKNGYVYVETVNIDDPHFTKSPGTWCHSKPFEHPFLFGKIHVDRILDKSGLEIAETFNVVANRYHLLARKADNR